MRRRIGAALAGLSLAVLTAGCVSASQAGEPAFDSAQAGLLGKPVKDITGPMKDFLSRQKSVHITAIADGVERVNADLSYTAAEGHGRIGAGKGTPITFRVIQGEVYVQRDGAWKHLDPGAELAQNLTLSTDFTDFVKSFYAVDSDQGRATTRLRTYGDTRGLAIKDSEGTELLIVNDPKAPAPERLTLKDGSFIQITDWSEKSLSVEQPDSD